MKPLNNDEDGVKKLRRIPTVKGNLFGLVIDEVDTDMKKAKISEQNNSATSTPLSTPRNSFSPTDIDMTDATEKTSQIPGTKKRVKF